MRGTPELTAASASASARPARAVVPTEDAVPLPEALLPCPLRVAGFEEALLALAQRGSEEQQLQGAANALRTMELLSAQSHSLATMSKRWAAAVVHMLAQTTPPEPLPAVAPEAEAAPEAEGAAAPEAEAAPEAQAEDDSSVGAIGAWLPALARPALQHGHGTRGRWITFPHLCRSSSIVPVRDGPRRSRRHVAGRHAA